MSAISAIGGLVGGIAQGNAASYQAQVARNNAVTAGQNATYAEQAGSAQTLQTGLKAAARQGAVKTSLAANGVDVNSGSAVDVQASQREAGSVDASTVMTNQELQAYGYRTQETNFDAQSKLDDQQASYAPIGAAFGALGSLAGGASQGSGLGGLGGFMSSIGGLGSIGSAGG